MSDKLLNWTPDKGDPYKPPYCRYKYGNPLIRILDEEEKEKIRKLTSNGKENSFSYSFPGSYYFYKICTITDLIALELLIGYYLDDEGLFNFSDDFEEIPEEIALEFDQPMNAYSSYAFDKMVEIKIPPFTITLKSRIDNVERAFQGFNLGYIIWQIANAYKNIYQNHAKEVGIYGHEFNDLAFGELTFMNNNLITVLIES